jgi:hypothetical protein
VTRFVTSGTDCRVSRLAARAIGAHGVSAADEPRVTTALSVEVRGSGASALRAWCGAQGGGDDRKEALAGPEHEREGHQPQLVDKVVLHQRGHEPAAGVEG